MERLSANFQMTDSNAHHFEGMASVFGSVVEGAIPTVIHPGAFSTTITQQWGRIKILYQHDPDWPIGKPVTLEERPTGLFVRARISDTAKGREVLQLMRDSVLDGLSIGFDPVRFDYATRDGQQIRNLRELRLWEISVVTFPADPMARITEANQRAGVPDGPEHRRAAPAAPPPAMPSSTPAQPSAPTSQAVILATTAIEQTLRAHGLPPDAFSLTWFSGPRPYAGRCYASGGDGQTITIALRSDVPLTALAETALHEAYHAVQYLLAPVATRDDRLLAQCEQQAQLYARNNFHTIQNLLKEFTR